MNGMPERSIRPSQKDLDIHAYSDCAFKLACRNGHLKVARCLRYKSIIKLHFNVHKSHFHPCQKLEDSRL